MGQRLNFFIAALLVAVAVKSVYALTQAQIASHIGAMLVAGINNQMRQGVHLEEITMVDVLSWGPIYRTTSSNGTLADRTEAMQAFYRFVYKRMTSVDPATATAAQTHDYRRHWLDQYVGRTEADAVEP